MSIEIYPDIDFHLNFTPFLPYTLFQGKRGVWNGCRGDFILHEEKEIFAQPKVDLLYVYGLGLGHHIRTLFSWLEKKPSHIIVILEDDLAVIAAFLQLEHAQSLLSHPQIHLRFISSNDKWDVVLEECARDFPFEHVEVVALNSYRRLKSARLRAIRLKILRKTVLWHALLSETIYSHLFTENVWGTAQHWPESFNANRLADKFQRVPAIICGAGPSLASAAPILKQLKEKALIIGCGSAISALGHFGITPDLNFALDPNRGEFRSLQGRLSPSTPLIYCSRLFPKVFELFNGPLGYLRSGTGGPLEAYLEKRLGIEEPTIGPDLGREALSSTTLAIAYAQALGCDPIILVGVDLAYTDLKKYAHEKGRPSLDEKRAIEQSVIRKDRHGRPLQTLIKWVMESDVISQFAANHPEQRFFNASEGLGFKKIPFLPLQQIAKEFCSQRRGISKAIAHNISDNPLCIFRSQLLAIGQELHTSLERCKKLCRAMIKEIKAGRRGGGSAILLESDFREELAYDPLLSSVGSCFFHIARKRAFLPHDSLAPGYEERVAFLEKAKWMHLKNVIQRHLETFVAVNELVKSPLQSP